MELETDNIKVFDEYYLEYEDWFERNKNIFLSELKLIKSLIPDNLNGIEIGAGSGIFAEPLGIKIGIEPSERMSELAKKRGINIINAKAEEIPLNDNSFDFVLMVTTICFVSDPYKAIKEAYRIIKPGGFIVIGFVPLDSQLGKHHEAKKDKSKFYKNAHFYTFYKIKSILEEASFKKLIARETLFEYTNSYIQDFKDFNYRGNFVAIKGEKSDL